MASDFHFFSGQFYNHGFFIDINDMSPENFNNINNIGLFSGVRLTLIKASSR
jgi:hypothetical protein